MPGQTKRVLVEHENPLVRERQAAALEAAGFEVATCAGPAWQEERTCPLVARGHCSMAFAADVIVNGLPLGHLPVYVSQRTYLHSCTVLLALSEKERVRNPILDSLATPVARNLTGEALVGAVRRGGPAGP